jgi:N-methylhydantoinase A
MLEMRYGAQVHTVRITIPRLDSYDAAALDDISRLFDETYERLFGAGSGYPAAGRFLTSFVVAGRSKLPSFNAADGNPASPQESAAHACTGEREAYFDGAFLPTQVYRYELLRDGDAVEGPAIVEAAEATVVIPPAASGAVDEQHNLRLRNLEPSGITAGALAAIDRGAS